MDEVTKQLLKETLEVSKANNVMLVKLARSQKRANIYRLVYWGVIVFFSFGIYYLIQPFMNNLMSLYTGGASDGSSFTDLMKNFSNKEQLNNLIDTIK